MMKISILVLVVLFEFVCSRSVPGPTRNATHAYTQFSTDGPAMNISQKCNKTLFEECTETKECCGVDVQCAQQNDSRVCQGAQPLCKNNYKACDPDKPNDCCSELCKPRPCELDASLCKKKNDTFCKVDNFRRDCPTKCRTCGYHCVGKWPSMGPIKFQSPSPSTTD